MIKITETAGALTRVIEFDTIEEYIAYEEYNDVQQEVIDISTIDSPSATYKVNHSLDYFNITEENKLKAQQVIDDLADEYTLQEQKKILAKVREEKCIEAAKVCGLSNPDAWSVVHDCFAKLYDKGMLIKKT